MPVIRLTPTATVFKAQEREALIAQLTKELAGEATQDGPVIFEIPLEEGSAKLDIFVVWDKWKDVPSEMRSKIITEAYNEKKDKIAQPLGVTYQEAIEQFLLPYAVIPMTRKQEVSEESLREAMKKHGGLVLEGGKVDLRFPTMEMAREAHQKLSDELPKGYWSIVQSAGSAS